MANVLLIEPDALIAATYKSVLEHAGYIVDRRATAQSAVTQADAVRPDIVILELQLVRHNGLEFLYEFRSYADWRAIPVVILSNVPVSAFNDSWNVLARGIGVSIYLYKPRTSLKRLLRVIRETLKETGGAE